MEQLKQHRIILFVHDGTGLGHLRRMSRIANAIQGQCAALVVSGLREASWMVPETCEFLHLPSWNSIRPRRAQYWDRPVWLEVSTEEALSLRCKFLAAAFDAFEPSAVLVDYLPYGVEGELKLILENVKCWKYFVLRGVVDTSDRGFLAGTPANDIGAIFDRIFVTADRRIVDVARQCELDETATGKVTYEGYVAPSQVDRRRLRAKRGLHASQQWVVCSAGGGMKGEAFLRHCISVAFRMPDVEFDVIFGPMSNLGLSQATTEVPANCRVLREFQALPELHASCDVAVTGGGYNSMIEAISGGARIIVNPVRTGVEDEQRLNATLLSEYYPVCLLDDPGDLDAKLLQTLESSRVESRPVSNLDLGGAERIRSIMLSDLNNAAA